MSARLRIFIVAGEPSGDVLGAKLMSALRRLCGDDVAFEGVGGERMAGEGLASLFAIEDLAVMGIAEVVPQIPVILRRLRETAAAIARARPDVLVTIDSPGFTLRLARRVRPLGLPMVHYVAPQLWAWRPERARKLVGLFDEIMAILPFEPAFFAGMGVHATYVGHPAIEAAATPVTAFRAEPAIAQSTTLVAMLPGSRRGVATRFLPLFADVARRLAASRRDVAIVVPVVAGTRALVEAATRGWSLPVHVVAAPEDKRAALAACTAAVCISGTSTLELTVADLPMVVVYRVNALTAWLARRLKTVELVAIPNLVGGGELVPELIQEHCTPERIFAALETLLDDAQARARQRAGFAEVRARLGAGEAPPSQRAAQVVLEVVRRAALRVLPDRAPVPPRPGSAGGSA